MECEILCVLTKEQIVDFGILVIALRWKPWDSSCSLASGSLSVQWGEHRFIAHGAQMRMSIKFFEKSLPFGTHYKSAYFYLS